MEYNSVYVVCSMYDLTIETVYPYNYINKLYIQKMVNQV